MRYQPHRLQWKVMLRGALCPGFHGVLVNAGVGIQTSVFPPSFLSRMDYLWPAVTTPQQIEISLQE